MSRSYRDVNWAVAESLRSSGIEIKGSWEFEEDENPYNLPPAQFLAAMGLHPSQPSGKNGNTTMAVIGGLGGRMTVDVMDPIESDPLGLPATAHTYGQSSGLRPLMQGNRLLQQNLSDYGQFEGKFYRTKGIDGGDLPEWAIGSFDIPLTVADILSNRGEVYTQSLWENNIPRLHSIRDSGKLIGTADHPMPGAGPLFSASLKFQDVYWGPERQDGGKPLWGTGYILGTPGGHTVRTLLDAGTPLDVSSRGYGRTVDGSWCGRTAQIVQSFICDGFDAVLDGASPGAGFKAGKLWQDVDEPQGDLLRQDIQEAKDTGLIDIPVLIDTIRIAVPSLIDYIPRLV